MDDVEKLAEIFKAFSDPTRLRLIKSLKRNNGALCVNALSSMLGVTQSAVSQHLRVLRQADLVIDEKRGYYVHYRLNEETFAKWKETLNLMLDVKLEECPGKKGDKKCAAATRKRTNARSRKT